MWFRSHRALAVAPLARVTTVTTRHWENEAVFRPRPKRPRSDRALFSKGLRLPNRIASSSSSSVIPKPSSRMPTFGSEMDRSANTRMVFACAAMELSMRSARAVPSEYPMSRMLSKSDDGLGGTSTMRIHLPPVGLTWSHMELSDRRSAGL